MIVRPSRDSRASTFSWDPTAYSLLLDQLAVRVCKQFAEHGIESIVLKGPTFAVWLWPDDQRGYGDIDLLVEPGEFERAASLLLAGGFTDKLPPGLRAGPRAARPVANRDELSIDLHRVIGGVGCAPTDAWRVLARHREEVEVAGAQLQGLDETARLLHVALHAATHLRELKPRLDLERALALCASDSWTEVFALADTLDARKALVTGLRSTLVGTQLLRSQGISAELDVDARLRLRNASPAAHGIDRIARSKGLWRRLRIVGNMIAPVPDQLRQSSRVARTGRLGLLIAYVLRPLVLLARAPRACADWAGARWGGSPHAERE